DFPRILRELPRPAVQPPLRAPSRRLLRPEPSGRGLLRDLRDLAHAGIGLAPSIPRLEGAGETRIRRSTDAQARRQSAAGFFQSEDQRRVAPALPPRSALQTAAPPLRPGISRLLRRRFEEIIRRTFGVAQRRARRDVPAPEQ